MVSEGKAAEHNADLVFDAHEKQIEENVYALGQETVVSTLRALANLIESSEFTFTAEWIH